MGGCFTLLVKCALFYIAVSKAKNMMTFIDPTFVSIEKAYDFDHDDPVMLGDMPKTMISIMNGEGATPEATVPMDKVSRKYVHIYIDNIFKTYDDAKEETVEILKS